jgi:hypothetical protein
MRKAGTNLKCIPRLHQSGCLLNGQPGGADVLIVQRPHEWDLSRNELHASPALPFYLREVQSFVQY